MERTVKRLNKYCAYYPCHKNLQDCTFCWCPFYPCLNRKLGYYVKAKKGSGTFLAKRIWSCDKCGWIHKKRIVDKIFKLIRKNLR